MRPRTATNPYSAPVRQQQHEQLHRLSCEPKHVYYGTVQYRGLFSPGVVILLNVASER